jgi:Rrf2 family protein
MVSHKENVLRISEGASMGLHAMVLLAGGRGNLLQTGSMARQLGVSQAHLAKVMQRLAHAGLVGPRRGPKGGFALGPQGLEVTLLEVYEAIEGPLGNGHCILGKAACGASRCIMGELLVGVNKQFRDYLSGVRLAQLADVYRS